MSSPKHARRAVADVEVELKAAREAFCKACEDTRVTAKKLKTTETDENLEAYIQAKRMRVKTNRQLQALYDELKELTTTDEVRQKRARLEPAYDLARAALAEAKLKADEQKERLLDLEAIERKTADDHARAKTAVGIQRSNYEHVASMVKCIPARNCQVVDPYNETFLLTPGDDGGSCPRCGDPDFDIWKPECPNKCVFHHANGASWHWPGGIPRYHEGALTDCTLLHETNE